jgi:hypothetical protein
MQAGAPARTTPRPGDRVGIARELQRELKRVGCYWGEVNGAWTPATRRAVKSFTDRINAALPIDQPDLVLLALVQAHETQACGVACPAGQSLAADGRCLPDALVEARRAEPSAQAGERPAWTPAITLQSSARTGAPENPASSAALSTAPPPHGLPGAVPAAAQSGRLVGQPMPSAARQAGFGPSVFRHLDRNGF